MSLFNGKTLLITGGTGSFGNAVLNRFLATDIGEIRIFSRDEKKQDDMRHEFQAKMPEVAEKHFSTTSFLTTNLISPSAGIMPLKAAGKITLPLSSTLTLYSPMNLIIVFHTLIDAKVRIIFHFLTLSSKIFHKIL